MSRENVEDVVRLSPVQQGLLFHTLSAPGSGVYFEQFNVRYGEGFDGEVFVRAWQLLVDRHPILRTGFLWENLEEPVQVVHKKIDLPVDRQDLTHLAGEEQAAAVALYAAADRTRGFDLVKAPLLRLGLLKLSDTDLHVVWSYHHLILDGWSAGLLMREILQTYQALLTGQEPRFENRRPFKDYITWLRGQSLGEAEKFWRQALAGFTTSTPVPIDRGAVAEVGGEAGWGIDVVRLSKAATARLKSFAASQRVTLNTAVQAAWALVLGRWSGERDVVFGTTVAGRPAALSGVDAMLGCFINTLPVRVKLNPETEISAWLKELLLSLLEMRRFEHSPLGEVGRWSELPRGQELFSTLLVFESFTPDAHFEISNKGVFQRTNYPLTVIAVDGPELALRVGFERARFQHAEVMGMLEAMVTLLEALPEHSGGKVGDLPPLPPALLAPVQVHGSPFESAAPLFPTLFAAQVAAQGHEIALGCGGHELTYAELAARAAGVAWSLEALGLRPEARVGICVERSPELLIAVLGVLGSGAAYVPLDPSFPEERLAYVAEDAGLAAILVDGSTAEFAARLAPSSTRLAVAELPPADTWPEVALEAESLAYVLYTSGSTGRPKGVEIEHRALANFLAAMKAEPGLEAGDRLLAVTTLSFDIAGLELLLPLSVGARVEIAQKEVLTDAEALAALLEHSGATVMQATPATWRLLLEAESWREAQSPRLKKALCGGEALPRELASELLPRVGELWNLYGPTETTIWSAASRVEPGNGPIPVGPPIAATRFATLDRRLERMPLGVPGELVIGGFGVARGYHGRPGLTAERFVPDPFAGSEQPGARMYRTGDLVRLRPEAGMDFLGRIDSQVKIRGFRIELGEVEAALARLPEVAQGVVVAEGQGSGNARLLAFLKAKDGMNLPKPQEIKAQLGSSLPDYMIPSVFVQVREFPLTPNGKVDRRALTARPGRARESVAGAGQAPRGSRGEPVSEANGGIPWEPSSPLEQPSVGPRDRLELVIARLFEETLGSGPVSVTESFFDLGGHSLSAVALIGKLKRQLGLQLTPAALLTGATVEALARQAAAASITPPSPLVPLATKGKAKPLYLVHPIGGAVFCYAALARHFAGERPVYALEASSGGNGTRPTLEELAAKYLAAVRTVQPSGPYHLGGWSMGGVIAHEMARQLEAQGQEVATLALFDAYPPAALRLPDAGDETRLLSWFAEDLGRQLGRALPLPASPGFADLYAAAVAAGLLPEGFEQSAARERFELFRANVAALSSHQPQPFGGRAVVFAGGSGEAPEWGPLVAGGVEVVCLEADHYGLLAEPTVSALALAWKDRLTERPAA